MAHIYISYGRKDHDIAQELSSEITNYGHDIVIYIDAPVVDQDWHTVLSKTLQGADVFVVLLSTSSIESTCVLKEIATAQVFRKIRQPFLILPVLIDDTTVPPAISDIDFINGHGKSCAWIATEIDRTITKPSVRNHFH